MTERKFFLGEVTNGHGKPAPDFAYITYGKSILPDDEEGGIEIRGTDAKAIATKLVDLFNRSVDLRARTSTNTY